MKRIAILGPGLLGGSLALALGRLEGVEVRMWGRREEVLREAVERGMAGRVSVSVREVVEGADTVVLCVPVGAMGGLVKEALPAISRDCLVTDVGSVKGAVVRELGPLLEGRALFVGSHPMAGSEKAGLGAARADLFEGAVSILTPVRETESEAVERVELLWKAVGARVRVLEPEVHDRFCAQISHVPHVVASALVNAVLDAAPEAFGFAGSGFRDTTRVAGGLPGMWSEILDWNEGEVVLGLRGVVRQLEGVIGILESKEGSRVSRLHAFLEKAKAGRDRLKTN